MRLIATVFNALVVVWVVYMVWTNGSPAEDDKNGWIAVTLLPLAVASSLMAIWPRGPGAAAGKAKARKK